MLKSKAIYEPSVSTLGSLNFGIREDGVVFVRRRVFDEVRGLAHGTAWALLDDEKLAAFLSRGVKIVTVNGATYYLRETDRLRLPKEGAPC